jgi:hypothetical protein
MRTSVGLSSAALVLASFLVSGWLAQFGHSHAVEISFQP